MESYLAPSILSADFARLGEETTAVLSAGADMIHFDVMDNHYVPNLTIGPMVCRSLRDYGIEAPIDVHLMVKPVDRIIGDFVEAGATYITFHPEATEHIDQSLELIHSGGCRCGLVLNPATPVSCLDHVMDKVDPFNVRQSWIWRAKIHTCNLVETTPRLLTVSREIRLEIDGGVKVENIGEIRAAGADTFVAGSAIFGSDDYRKTIALMRTAIQQGE